MIKKELRKKYKSIRSDVSEPSLKNDKITRKLLESDIFQRYNKIFLYYPSGTEVSTVQIAENALTVGKKVAFPRCIDRSGNMEFRFVNSLEHLSEGMYGLIEPDVAKSEAAVPDNDTLIIVPGLAFDIMGHRLGYGGGYYDRYLSDYKCYTVGLAYSECVCDSLPTTIYDVKINCLISDNNTYIF